MIRRYLLAGLFTLLPLVVTIWILRWIFDALIGIFSVSPAGIREASGSGLPVSWQEVGL